VPAAQPGHWLGPVTGPGWLDPAPKKYIKIKNRKIEKQKNKKGRKKKYVCMNKNNINLLVYSLTLESGIKIPV